MKVPYIVKAESFKVMFGVVGISMLHQFHIQPLFLAMTPLFGVSLFGIYAARMYNHMGYAINKAELHQDGK